LFTDLDKHQRLGGSANKGKGEPCAAQITVNTRSIRLKRKKREEGRSAHE